MLTVAEVGLCVRMLVVIMALDLNNLSPAAQYTA